MELTKKKYTEITVKITDSGQRFEPVTFQFGSRSAVHLSAKSELLVFGSLSTHMKTETKEERMNK